MKKLYKLFIIAAVSLFGTTPAFALRYAKVVVNSSPTEGGYVAASTGTPSLGTKTNDEAKNNNTKISDYTFNFGIIAGAKSGYVFKGWSMSSEDNSGDITNPKTVGVKATSSNNTAFSYATATYYAIFARMIVDGANSRTISCNVGQDVSEDIVVKHVHAGTVTASVSGQYYSITSSTTASSTSSEVTTTFTVKYKPTTAGKHVGTLTISSNNGLANQVVTLNGTGIPELVFDNNLETSYYVGDAAIDLSSLFTCNGDGDKTYSVSFSPEVGVPTVGATAPVISDNKMLSLSQAGTLIVKLAHENGDVVPNGEKTVTISIVRRPNPVTVLFDGNSYADNTFNMAYGVGASVLVRTANESNTITIAQNPAGADLATYYDDQHAVYTSYKSGIATWSVSQPENYKYLAASATFTVNIAPAEASGCLYMRDLGAEGKQLTGKLGSKTEEITWTEEGVTGTLSFSVVGQKVAGVGSVGNSVQAYQRVDNVWSKVGESIDDYSNSTYSYHEVELDSRATGFYFTIAGSYTSTIKEARVTRKTYLTTSITAAEGLRIPDCRLGESKSATFNINWSRPSSSKNIHIESDNDHFTLSQNVIDNVSCNHGTTPITVTYTPVKAGEENDTLTIYDESQVITLVVHGKVVDKFTPEIDWLVPAIVKPNTSYVGLSNIVTSNSPSPLVITSSDETIATYDAATQTLQTYDKEGFVVFTVSQIANEDFHAITLQFSVFVTNKESQMCILYEDATKHELTDVANLNVGEFDINLDAPVSMISADIWKTNSIATGSIVVKWSDGDGNKLGEKEVGVEKLSTSAKNFVMQLPRDTRNISFKVKGTLSKFVQNIKVYRAQYLEHNAVLTDGALNFGSDEYGAESTVREFDILYSGAGDFSVSSSNNELFTVESVSDSIDCEHAYGSRHVVVYYNHNVVSNEHTANLNVQLGTMVLSIPLVGATDRPSSAVFIGNDDDDWNDPNSWLGGVTPADSADITIKGDLVISDGESRTVHSLNIESTGSVLVVNNGTLTINAASSPAAEYGDLHVNTGGVVIVHNSLTVRNLYLEATPISNQGATLAGTTQVNGNAYLDIHMDPSGTLNDRNYYSFSLPFASSQVQRYNKNTSAWESALSGRDYRAYYYDEQERATNGKSNATWISTTSFLPGVFYLIEFANADANTYRFMCSDLSSLNNSESIQLSSSSAADDSDRGWNGIGNTGIGYANPNLSCAMQALDGDNNAFILVEGASALAMGRAVFVQVDAAAELLWIPSVSPALAPRRVEASVDETYTLNINRLGSDDRDDCLRLIVSDDAQPSYQIGHDLVKMSMGQAKVAQMWINAYDQQLVINEVALNDGIVNCDLGLYAPAAAEYEIALQDLPTDGTMIYLTRDGKAVANLTYGSYVLDLQKGNTTGYGIRVNRRKVVTDIDELLTTDTPAAKQLINGTLYIIRGARVYDMQGRLVHE